MKSDLDARFPAQSAAPMILDAFRDGEEDREVKTRTRIVRPRRIVSMFATVASLLFSTAIGVSTDVSAQRSAAPLSCELKKISADDTLILRFRMPHPAELAIRAPGNIWYFLVYDPDKSSPAPIVDKASFAKMSEMRLPVATARGIRWEGDGKNEVMFQQSGTYEVILTNILETEDVPAFRCKIAFSRRR